MSLLISFVHCDVSVGDNNAIFKIPLCCVLN